MRTSGTISATSIAAQSGRSLCVNIFHAAGGGAIRRICLRLEGRKARMAFQKLSHLGLPSGTKVLSDAAISRPAPNRLVVTAAAASLGIGIGPYRWQAASTWRDAASCPAPGCSDQLPTRPQRTRFSKPSPVGCVANGPSVRSNGPRGKRVVALSFDDGPSIDTESMLANLRRYKAHATFFELGGQMSGRASIQRDILAQGNMIGDHSWSHPVLSGGGPFAASEITRTKARIKAQTGFTPCLFRAPYGAISSSLVGIARSHGLLTIQWDVDPQDWSRPGTAAIVSRVLSQVRQGSIILMHDGGGPRSESVAASNAILASLTRRGYRVVSVETLLGLKTRY